MDARKLACLDAMGIDVWVERAASKEFSEKKQEAIIENIVEPENKVSDIREAENAIEILEETAKDLLISLPVSAVDSDDWGTLEKKVLSCVNCDLHKTRTQAVFGVGNQSADCLIIGEAPGAEEDKQGEPFVGRAGKLLNAMLQAVGLKREQVYITNILKCRPPDNRDPRPDEVACCEAYLQRQIALIEPKIILCVGRIAAQSLLKQDSPVGQMRGKQYIYGPSGTPVIVTYHPAYLLRSPRQKSKAWEDLLLARSLLEDS